MTSHPYTVDTLPVKRCGNSFAMQTPENEPPDRCQDGSPHVSQNDQSPQNGTQNVLGSLTHRSEQSTNQETNSDPNVTRWSQRVGGNADTTPEYEDVKISEFKLE